MPEDNGWIEDVPGIKDVVDKDGVVYPRRKAIELKGDVTVEDVAGKTRVTIGAGLEARVTELEEGAESATSADWPYDTGNFDVNLYYGEETSIVTIAPESLIIGYGAGEDTIAIPNFGATGKRAVLEAELWATDPQSTDFSDWVYGEAYYGDAIEVEQCIATQTFVRENNGWLENTGDYNVSTESDEVPGIASLVFENGETKLVKVVPNHNGKFTFRMRLRVRSEIVTGITPIATAASAVDGEFYLVFSTPMDIGKPLPAASVVALTGAVNITGYMDPPWLGNQVLRFTTDGEPNYDVDEAGYTPDDDNPILSASGGTLAGFSGLVVEAD